VKSFWLQINRKIPRDYVLALEIYLKGLGEICICTKLLG
jgi:hypothetical protein